MIILANVLSTLIDIYIFIIIAHVAVGWLVAFRVLDNQNPQAQNLVALLKKLTDPVFKPVQKYVPPIGGLDITPIIVIIGIQILAQILFRILV